MISKANSRIGMIKRSFSNLSVKTFKLLYKSLVRPILEYCSSIWSPLYKEQVLEIEKVQRRATKLIKQFQHLPYSDRLKRLNLTTLVYRRHRTDVLQVFRIIHQIDKISFDDFFTYNRSNTRGHSYQLSKPRAETKLRQNTFSHRVVNVWNSLTEEVVSVNDINIFKSKLEDLWKHKDFKYDPEAPGNFWRDPCQTVSRHQPFYCI